MLKYTEIITVKTVTLYKKLYFFIKSLKSKKKKQRLGLDINISTKYVNVTKHTHTARMKKPPKSCCECNEN